MGDNVINIKEEKEKIAHTSLANFAGIQNFLNKNVNGKYSLKYFLKGCIDWNNNDNCIININIQPIDNRFNINKYPLVIENLSLLNNYLYLVYKNNNGVKYTESQYNELSKLLGELKNKFEMLKIMNVQDSIYMRGNRGVYSGDILALLPYI